MADSDAKKKAMQDKIKNEQKDEGPNNKETQGRVSTLLKRMSTVSSRSPVKNRK